MKDKKKLKLAKKAVAELDAKTLEAAAGGTSPLGILIRTVTVATQVTSSIPHHHKKKK
jgi:hypothetical protein